MKTYIRSEIAAACLMMSAVLSPLAARADAVLDRGRYLMNGIVACGNCHTPRKEGKPDMSRELSGGDAIDAPIFHAVPANITPDKETGIGRWSDAEIIKAIREGHRPNGSTIGPPMPIAFYKDMSDDDARAIVAYLRAVKPVVNKTASSTYKIPLPPAYGPPITSIKAVKPAPDADYGKYLATALGHCMDCHTPLVQGRNDMSKMGAGGNSFGGPNGVVWVSADLTPANKLGIAGWTDAQLKAAIQTGVRPNGTRIAPLMAFDYYKTINDADMTALVAFLRKLPPSK